MVARCTSLNVFSKYLTVPMCRSLFTTTDFKHPDTENSPSSTDTVPSKIVGSGSVARSEPALRRPYLGSKHL